MAERRSNYRYRVKNSRGKIITGRATAQTPNQVRKVLEGKGYTVLAIFQEKNALAGLGWKKISSKDRSILYRELSTMLKAGISITQAIEIGSDTPNKKLKKVLSEVYQSLENGFPLSVAMASHPTVFPEVEVGVIKAGEATGNLARVLHQLAETTNRSADFSSRVRGAMIYPIFIVVVMIGVGFLIMARVIPQIKEIFVSSGAELPATTRFLLSFTDLIRNGWQIGLVGLALLIVLLRLFFLTKPGRRFGSYLALNVPVVGKLNQRVFLAHFNRTLSLLVGSGVPIIQAMQIITESTVNTIYRSSLVELIKSLEQGSAVSVSLQRNKYFPKLMTQLLFVGQQSGDLGGSATTLADYFESEVDETMRGFSALIEPFIIVLLGVTIGFIVLAVLQPIYNLSGAI